MKVLVALFGLVLAAAINLPTAHADDTADFHPGHGGGHHGPGHGGPGHGGPGHGGGHMGRLCWGTYDGQYSNGVPARFFLDGNRITIKVGDWLYTGFLRCEQYGGRAEIRYRASHPAIPGQVIGHGQVFAGHHGRASIGVNQNNGLSFNGWGR